MSRQPLQAEPFFFAATKIRFGRGRSSSRRPLQAEPFFLAATKNRIGRGTSLPQQLLQASHSSLQRRRLESDAEDRCRNSRCRRNHSPLASIRKSELEIKNRCTQEGLTGEIFASIRKFGLEIKNQCTKEGVNGEKHTSIPKSGLEIKNRCTKEGLNGNSLHRFASLALKSRIDARKRA